VPYANGEQWNGRDEESERSDTYTTAASYPACFSINDDVLCVRIQSLLLFPPFPLNSPIPPSKMGICSSVMKNVMLEHEMASEEKSQPVNLCGRVKGPVQPEGATLNSLEECLDSECCSFGWSKKTQTHTHTHHTHTRTQRERERERENNNKLSVGTRGLKNTVSHLSSVFLFDTLMIKMRTDKD